MMRRFIVVDFDEDTEEDGDDKSDELLLLVLLLFPVLLEPELTDIFFVGIVLVSV